MTCLKIPDKLLSLLLLLFKFGIAGMPSFLIAIPLNWFLVEKILLNKPIAYLITLLFQVAVNFVFLRLFVFKSEKQGDKLITFFKFFWGIAFFRLLDWGLYTLLVQNTEIYFLFLQIGNVVIFSLAKFFYSKKVMEK
jgi:putative flippase GtrA